MTFDWNGRRVLVTGATGIVGSWLCEELATLGAYTVALVRDYDPQSRLFTSNVSSRCSVVNGELESFSTCKRMINDHEIEVVFHLAAQTIVGAALRDPLGCFESNIRGTYNLLEAARQMSGLVRTVVVASSDKAYGESPILPYTEDLPLRGTHPYDVSKSCTDLISHTYAYTYGMNVSIARCGNIYGGGDLNWSRIVPGTIRSVLNGQAPILRSDGSLIRDYIYVKDVVVAYLCLAENASRPDVRGEAFNFSPESEHTVLEIVEAISHAMGVDIRPVIQNSAKMEIKRQTLDSSKARRLLNWQPKWGLAEGLRETIEWYRDYLGKELVAYAV